MANARTRQLYPLQRHVLERAYIRRVLEKTGGHKARAAKILGLDRRTLYRKVAELTQSEGGEEPE
jgi:DNA-binding NtrC family response regulator